MSATFQLYDQIIGASGSPWVQENQMNKEVICINVKLFDQ